MSNEGMDYDVVLKEAQELGYAERNPEADVEGFDAWQKNSNFDFFSIWFQPFILRRYTQKVFHISQHKTLSMHKNLDM